MLATVLQAQGYRVDVSPSAQAALDALRDSTYQLVLVHYGLPDLSGVALLEEARAEGVLHGAAQMLFTGKASLQSSGTTAVLHKPIDLQDLVRQVHYRAAEGPRPPPCWQARRRKTAEAQAAARPTAARAACT